MNDIIEYVPVFTKDGNKFIILSTDHIADTEDDAWKIGIGCQLVEGILYGFKYDSVIKIKNRDIINLEADFGQLKVGLIAGELFDSVEGEVI